VNEYLQYLAGELGRLEKTMKNKAGASK
jgi:hypothetical protein